MLRQGLTLIYYSPRADDYNGEPSWANFKALLVARVALGNGYTMYRTSKRMTDPPDGYHSVGLLFDSLLPRGNLLLVTQVLGEVGEDLNYDEQVVYRDDAIIPAYLVIYGPREERTGYARAY